MKISVLKHRLEQAKEIVLLFLLTLPLSGCLYLNDPVREKSAATALGQYQSFQTNAGDVFDLMLANEAKVNQSMAAREAFAARLKFNAYCSTVSYETWDDISNNIMSEQSAIENESNRIDKSFAEIVTRQLELDTNASTANQALTAIQNKLTAADKAGRQWLARGQLFSGVLAFYTGQQTNLSKLDKNVLQRAQTNILGGVVQGTTNTVGEILKGDLQSLQKLKLSSVAGNYTVDLFDPKKAPGITVQILGMGVDLARSEVRKIQDERDSLNSLKSAYGDEIKYLMQEKGDLDLARNLFPTVLSTNVVSHDQSVLQTIKVLQKNQDELRLTSCGMLLGSYLMAITLDKSILLESETRPAAIAHEQSITLSQINAAEQSALVLRGLQSLSQYYQGGVTPQQIANLINAAEAAGIAVIGARVGN